MKTFIVILSEIKSIDQDKRFTDFVTNNKFDYWRYTALNWVLVTPDTITIDLINNQLFEAYGLQTQFVFEVDIKDVGGTIPLYQIPNTPEGWTPFLFFERIKKPDFVPTWLYDSSKTN